MTFPQYTKQIKVYFNTCDETTCDKAYHIESLDMSLKCDECGYIGSYYIEGEKYRIGYSHSNDGINWKNKLDKVGIDLSNSGWDSEMICYPFVFDHKGKRYMLYNGNSYGKYGFGLAKLIEQ